MKFEMQDIKNILQISDEIGCYIYDTTCYTDIEEQPFIGSQREPVVVHVYDDYDDGNTLLSIYQLNYDYATCIDRECFVGIKIIEEYIEKQQDYISFVKKIAKEKGFYIRLLFLEYRSIM